MFKLGDKVRSNQPHQYTNTIDHEAYWVQPEQEGTVVTVAEHLENPGTFIVRWDDLRLAIYHQGDNYLLTRIAKVVESPPPWGLSGP